MDVYYYTSSASVSYVYVISIFPIPFLNVISREGVGPVEGKTRWLKEKKRLFVIKYKRGKINYDGRNSEYG